MMRGWPLRQLIGAGVLFVGAVAVLAVREQLPALLVWPLVLGVLAAVVVLVAVAWRKR
jgi:hypothetical protein